MTDGRMIQGRLMGIADDTLLPAFGTRLERIPASEVRTVSERLRRDYAKGAKAGFKVGGAVGLLAIGAGLAIDLRRACDE